jgi:uncharacterized protein (TIGR02145 family)
VNCGYHKDDFKYGKLYQWGRKYGQGYTGALWDSEVKTDQVYSDSVIPEVVEGLVYLKEYQSLDNADVYFDVPGLLNPKTFPHYRSTLWNHGSDEAPVRSEYDPCPEGWRVPTYNELTTIVSNRVWGICNGQYGCYFTDSNTQQLSVSQIFLPATGLIDDGFADCRGNGGCYWSSLSSENAFHNMLVFDPIDYFLDTWLSNKAPAAAVRCVKDDTEVIPVESISINKTELTLSVGATETLSASFLPANANHKEVYWYSKDNWVATVDASGQIEAKGVGRVTITAMAGMQTAECVVTVVAVQEGDYIDEYGVNHGQGVEIDGVVWAPVNCGYKAPTADSKGFPYGKLYQWGRKYGQGYSLDYDESEPIIMEGPVSLEEAQSLDNEVFFYKYGNHYTYDCITPMNDKYWNSGTEENPKKSQYDPCPNGWRVPTITELNNLRNNKSSETINSVGIEGCWFSGFKVYSDSVPRVFLPVAGSRGGHYGDIYDRGFQGDYWSSTVSRKDGPYSYCAQYLHFISSYDSLNDSGRAHAHSVRCVQE